MAKQGDQVTFTSVNDGKDHAGTVRQVHDSPMVRQAHGGEVLIVDAPDTRRGWEIVPGSNVRSR